MTETERAKQLASDHAAWVIGYNRALGLEMIPIAAAEYLYRTAIYHGYGHGVESERGGMFRPSIGEPLTAAEVSAISRPCSDCLDEKKCGGRMRWASGDCLHHRPRVEKSCESCGMSGNCTVEKLYGLVCHLWHPVIPDQQHPRKEV